MLLFYLIMNLKIFNFILLILIFQNVNANTDELFGNNSIIRKLINESGSFRSEIKIIDDKKINIQTEQYSFKYKNGKISLPETKIDEYYLNDLKQIHRIYLNRSVCLNFSFNDSDKRDIFLKKYLIRLAPESAIDISGYKLKGASHFLFSLINYYDKNKDNVKCLNLVDKIRCDLELGNNSKIEYYFESRNEFKMYPIKIRTFKKEFNRFKLCKEIEYIQFDYSFNGDDFKVDLDLLISKNCNVIKSNLETEEGNQFNDLYTNWTYLNSIAKGGKGGKGGDKDGNGEDGEDGEDGEWGGKGGKGGRSGVDIEMVLIICGLSASAIIFIVIAIFKCRNRIFNNKSNHLISYKS